MKRRKFIQQTSHLAAGLAIAPVSQGIVSCSSTKTTQEYPIIDTHQHLWDRSIAKLKWTGPPIDKGDFLIPEYRKEVDGLNVIKTLYMEVDIPAELRDYEAQFSLDLCADPTSKMVGTVIYGHPGDDDFRSYILKYSSNPHLKGVRCRGKKEKLFSEKALSNIQWLGDQGLRFDLGVNPTWLGDCVEMVKNCPNTTFILNHCGTADPVALFPEDIEKPRAPKYGAQIWKEDMSNLGAQSNVVCKISGIVAHVPGYNLEAKHLAPTIDHCLVSFGEDRVIFAGDWPTCLFNMPLRQWILTLKEIVKFRTFKEQKKLFHDNAERIYQV